MGSTKFYLVIDYCGKKVVVSCCLPKAMVQDASAAKKLKQIIFRQSILLCCISRSKMLWLQKYDGIPPNGRETFRYHTLLVLPAVAGQVPARIKILYALSLDHTIFSMSIVEYLFSVAQIRTIPMRNKILIFLYGKYYRQI